MGSRFAVNLVQRGHELPVWNRNPERAPELKASGVRVASSPRQVANDADAVLSMVRDDEASRAVWIGKGRRVGRNEVGLLGHRDVDSVSRVGA